MGYDFTISNAAEKNYDELKKRCGCMIEIYYHVFNKSQYGPKQFFGYFLHNNGSEVQV